MKRKRIGNRGIRVINSLIEVTEGLLDKIAADMKFTRSVPIEIYRNRCINNIGRLNKLDRKRLRIPDNIYIEAKERMFNTYFELQDYNSSERQTKDNKKEIPIDTILDIIDNYSVESYSAETYTGGLGFSASRGILLGDRLGSQSYYDHYFKKVPVLPVRTLAKEEWHDYKGEQTTEEWREEMIKQKKEVLDGQMQ
tara:strand:+ start:976 stop:1563 length:588 start_codon:yes stop_codon:yes gene_type:complete